MSITMKDYLNREAWLAARKELGIGASEVATVCGANKYETALQLWEERTGRREKKENDAMKHGHEREPIIRDRIMQRWGAYFDLQYNEFGMWINDEYPNQFATLDGILIAKEDNPAVNIGGVVIPVKKGEKIILEIKSSEPKRFEDYLAWRTMPTNYKYQAAAQMMCSGINSHILIAELAGTFASKPLDERFFFHTRTDVEDLIAEIQQSVPKFFAMQNDGTAPDQGVDLANAVITVNPTLGTITDNLDELKTMVELCAERYKGLTFTEEQCSDAKKMRAELNKAVKQINEKRISVSKQWNEPYDAFKTKCDEIIKIITDVSKPIDDQIKAFEKAEETKKLQDITDYIKSCLDGDYKDLEPLFTATAKCIDKDSHILGVKKNPKWVNKGCTMQTIQAELETYFRNTRKDYQTLYDLKSTFGDFWDAIYAEYISSGLSLVSAINKKNQLSEARQAQIEMQRRQEEAKARAEAAAQQRQPEPELPIEEKPAPVPQSEVAKPQPQKKIYTKCVEFAHTDVSKFNDLIKVLKQLGFKFREVKNYEA